MMSMPHRKNRGSASSDREIIAKAEGRFAKADKQRASIKANPKRAITREQERMRHFQRAKPEA